jgi:hypothetical protein
MFLNLDKLNEGVGKNTLSNPNGRDLGEGENPKAILSANEVSGWQSEGSHVHVNRRWEKLRR